MSSLYLLIPIALIFCVIAVKLLLWAINSGQYDDLDKEAWRVLSEDEASSKPQAQPQTSSARVASQSMPWMASRRAIPTDLVSLRSVRIVTLYSPRSTAPM